MEWTNHYLFSFLLDGQGGGQTIPWDTISKCKKKTLWIHANNQASEFRKWLLEESKINEIICDALLAEDTHPRTLLLNEGLLVIFRSANISPTAEPEDLIPIRIWIDEHRIISTSTSPLPSIEKIHNALEKGIGPHTVGECLVDIAENIIDRIENIIDNTNAKVDALEEVIFKEDSHYLRPRIVDIRHEIIDLRHYLTPQRDVLAQLQAEQIPWLTNIDRLHLREVQDRNIRFIEDLEVARDDTNVLQEVLASRISEKVGHRMYILSMVAAIFLPLGFFASLLGINVAGIPAAEEHWAFAIVSVIMLLIAVFEFWIFKKKKWF